MTTERQKLFVRMMTPLFRAQQSVTDLFFKNRLDEDIEYVIDKHIQYQVSPSEESRREHIRALKDLDKVLQEITYLEKGDVIQLAFSREQVLQCLYSFLQKIRVEKQTPAKTEVTKVVVKTVAPVIQKPSRNRSKLTETQEKILEFVRQEPDCRTKDVVSQFSALSQRTVKRGLKELSQEGKIVKKIDGGAVYYSAA